MTDKERQQDEIEVLQSIYPQELSVVSEQPASGCLKISPSLIGEDMIVKVITVINEKSEEKLLNVKYLPPIELFFMCPPDYPSKSQPFFMLNCIWLPDKILTQICNKLDDLWDNSKWEILYSWASFLKEDCCAYLKLDKLEITLNMDYVKKKSLENTNVDSENSLNDISFTNRKNIHLRELKNKTMHNEYDNVACREIRFTQRKMKKYRHFKKDSKQKVEEDCFKYETPKDIEKKESVPNRLISLQSSHGQSCSNSKYGEDKFRNQPLSKTESILNMINMYGKRSKTRSEEFDSRVLPKTSEVTSVVNQIVEYNDRCLDVEFRSGSHSCDICFETKPPSACVCVKPCRHAFCKTCMKEYLTVNIRENQVQSLRCLDPTCDTVLSSHQIRQNVDDATFEKYQNFSLNMVVQNDPKLMYCPRKFCQGVAKLMDLNRGMCYCDQCCFYFCFYCRKGFHGVELCKFKSEERSKVIQEYQTASSSRKAELEKCFTKQQITKWIQEEETEKMIKECSEPCPNCGAMIEKNLGCNKMICTNCNTPFCWLCKSCLNRSNPYGHYQNPNSPCYDKLFPFAAEEEFEIFDFDENFYLDDVEEDGEWYMYY